MRALIDLNSRRIDFPLKSSRKKQVSVPVLVPRSQVRKSPEAIPALRDALAQATDLDEKVKIQQAIDFLTLMVPAADTNSANPQQ